MDVFTDLKGTFSYSVGDHKIHNMGFPMIGVLYSECDIQIQSPFVQIHTRLVADKSNVKVQLVSIKLPYCSLNSMQLDDHLQRSALRAVRYAAYPSYCMSGSKSSGLAYGLYHPIDCPHTVISCHLFFPSHLRS